MMATESWDGAIERRVQHQTDRRQRWTRRKGDWIPCEEKSGGVLVLIAGIGIGAVTTMFWAFVASILQSWLG